MRIITTQKFSVIDVNNIIPNDNVTSLCLSQLPQTQQQRPPDTISQQQQQQQHVPQQPLTSLYQSMGIYLDIDEPYTRSVILKAFQHPCRVQYFHISLGPGVGWEPISIPSHCQFQWSEYERIDWHTGVLSSKHGASSYCIRKGLSRKAQLAYHTRRHICKYPNSILRDAIPQTIVIDCWSVWDDDNNVDNSSNMTKHTMTHSNGYADAVISIGTSGMLDSTTMNRRVKFDICLEDAKQAMDDAESKYEANGCINDDYSAPVWILKGSTTNKGVGIFIVHLYEQVVDHCWNDPSIREWVLQRYITQPLLLKKRKFHIRAYVLAVSALRVYLYRRCLALCSGHQYRDDTYYTNPGAHITNTAYQIETNSTFREHDCVLEWNEEFIGPILVDDGTFHTIEEANCAIQSTIEKMGAIIGELFKAYKSECNVFNPIDGCFEHFGLDFIIDDTWNVFLLEVNPGPDFKQTGNKLESLIEDLMGCTIDVALLPQVTGISNEGNDQLILVYEQDHQHR